MSVINKSALTLLGLLSSATASAVTGNVGGVADRIYGNFASIGGMAVSLFLLVGIFFVGLGLLKIKENRDNPGQAPLKLALAYIIAGGLLASIMGIMTIAPDSFFVGTGDNVPTHQRIIISDSPNTSRQ